MRSLAFGAASLVVGIFVATQLTQRYREEKLDHDVVLLADWTEIRQAIARGGRPLTENLSRLKQAGVDGILITASSVRDYVSGEMRFKNRAEADAVAEQMRLRQIAGISVKAEGHLWRIEREGKTWDDLLDAKLGFEPSILSALPGAGLSTVLRIENDSWLAVADLWKSLDVDASKNVNTALLFSSEDIPGDLDALPQWAEFARRRSLLHMLVEFKPGRAARSVAARLPERTYRAHTITPSEMKDLSLDQELSRWSRAYEERSCRFLLIRMSADDSLESYEQRVQGILHTLAARGARRHWPIVRSTWKVPSFIQTKLLASLALLVAILAPILALVWGRNRNPTQSVIRIFLATLILASVAAACADNPYTRLQIVPFRGIKLAIVAGWLGCFAALFTWEEIRHFAVQSVRRVDVVAMALLGGVLAYLLMRTGNAGATWKVGWEQHLRDTLEHFLIARPRFKEFAVGYPLLILGLHCQQMRWGRALVGIGMIGPVTMVNTFLHLHSPLALAYLRSFNGIMLGALFGTVAWMTFQWLKPR